ncbi:hypothetical protein [Bradyrhizobium sp. AUGA SZCCT0160]|uniref:hypothetical protein n=1 Tax=Bradyrhizobium sp. AUGA SZCCT0160 TaxID=2807662 RepID=UPI001BACD753|nr:hypothetical protein [Bradyrhizobium sp. AUGA SZCCT0160]MBR1193311.1 hypothetical protein [Bradyrhizobium sp. AUGA SZCCT0160]
MSLSHTARGASAAAATRALTVPFGLVAIDAARRAATFGDSAFTDLLLDRFLADFFGDFFGDFFLAGFDRFAALRVGAMAAISSREAR